MSNSISRTCTRNVPTCMKGSVARYRLLMLLRVIFRLDRRCLDIRKTIIEISKTTSIHRHCKITFNGRFNFNNIKNLPSTGMTQLKIRIKRIRELQISCSSIVEPVRDVAVTEHYSDTHCRQWHISWTELRRQTTQQFQNEMQIKKGIERHQATTEIPLPNCSKN